MRNATLISTVTDFLEKLDNNFKILNSEDRKELNFDKGMTASYNIVTSESFSFTGQMVFQAVIRITINGTYVRSFGAETEEDNKKIVQWFTSHHWECQNLERRTRRAGEDFFDNIMA